MGSEHGTETSSTSWWVFRVTDNPLCVLLRQSAVFGMSEGKGPTTE
jgi:hypothetical protein